MIRTLSPLGLLLLVACQTTEHGLIVAKRSLHGGDLLRTIVLLDQIPAADPEYTEARALANAVERRMRTGQKLFGKGLGLRAEWRDEESLAYFEMAREVWPRIHGAKAMIRATKNRMATMEARATNPEQGDIAAQSAPVMQVVDEETGVPQQEDNPPAAPIAELSLAETARELLRVKLREVESLLRKGQLENGLELLEELYAADPKNKSVQKTMIRVLHQRALLHYGQGSLQLAVIDWSELLRLDPEHRQARAFMVAAQTELRTLHGEL